MNCQGFLTELLTEDWGSLTIVMVTTSSLLTKSYCELLILAQTLLDSLIKDAWTANTTELDACMSNHEDWTSWLATQLRPPK